MYPYNKDVLFLTILIAIYCFHNLGSPVHAITDPLARSNNKIGIHILFPSEVIQAAKLVNHDGEGSWGYVTIPIQASDRDRTKWQTFLDECKTKKVIPIIRVATVPDGSNWAEPNNFDLIDFANFLGDLQWPVENRYVIIFNEVNRADEYGGYVSPEMYADILRNASDIFKNVSPDFFILPAGLDNAAGNTKTSLNWRLYIERMYLRHPDIFDKIDGWTSHAYPNPDFSSRPDKSGANKIDSFKSDLKFIRLFTKKKLPVFITEAGWSGKYLSEQQVSLYYQYAFSHPWSDSNIVAITPFLFDAQEGAFADFSFTKTDGTLKEFATTLSSYVAKGDPQLAQEMPQINNRETISTPSATPHQSSSENSQTLLKRLYNSFQSLLKLFNQ